MTSRSRLQLAAVLTSRGTATTPDLKQSHTLLFSEWVAVFLTFVHVIGREFAVLQLDWEHLCFPSSPPYSDSDQPLWAILWPKPPSLRNPIPFCGAEAKGILRAYRCRELQSLGGPVLPTGLGFRSSWGFWWPSRASEMCRGVGSTEVWRNLWGVGVSCSSLGFGI